MVRKSSRNQTALKSSTSKLGKGNTKQLAAVTAIAVKKKRNVRPGNCHNCGCDETETDLWRTNSHAPPGSKAMVCNACGLWSRDHGSLRPPHMWKHLKARAEKAKAAEQAAAATASTAHGSPREEASTVSTLASTSSTPTVHSPVVTPSEPARLTTSPGRSTSSSPSGDYFSYNTRKPTEEEDAASALLAMYNQSLHQAPPPLARAPPSFASPFPSHGYEHPIERSHSLDGHPATSSRARSRSTVPAPHPAAPSWALFDRAPHSAYVPAWMDQGHRAPTIVPTTPTRAFVGRRHSHPECPSPLSTTPTAPSFVRPSLANILHSVPRSPAPSEQPLPALVYDRERRGSQTTSYASSMTNSPPTPHLGLGDGYPVVHKDDGGVPDVGRLRL